MFQNMSKNNIVIFCWQYCFFKKCINEFYLVAKLFLRSNNGLIRSFYTSNVIKVRQQALCKISFKTPHFEAIAGFKKRHEGLYHKPVHNIKIKIISILMICSIL